MSERDKVDQFHARIVAMMDLASQQERESYIADAVDELFDIHRIARVSLGRSWRGLTPEAQSAFAALLKEHVIATYADRFDSNKGQVFVTHGSKEVRNGVVVASSVTPRNGDTVKLDYFFRDGKVFNIAADGVSDLSLRRADYNSVLKERGFEALVAHLQQKLDEIRLEKQ